MKKTWIIARSEFTSTIRRVSYILLTAAFPVLALLGILIYIGVTSWVVTPPPEELNIGYVDGTGIFDDYTHRDGIVFVPYDTAQEARQALLQEHIREFFVIPEDYVATGLVTRYTTARELEPPWATIEAMEDFMVANLLSGEVSEDVLARAQTPILYSSFRLDPETGETIPPEDYFSAFGMPYIFGILFMISLFTTSGYLLQGVAEEKENRLIEILLSSVSTRQLLTGKVLGLGSAGLMQIVIWLAAAVVTAAVASAFVPPLSGISIPIGLIVLGIVYFVLGYLLFAILMAAIGSLGSNARESNQWTVVITLPAVIPIMVIPLFIENPGHVVFTVLALFPITAPVTAIMKLSISSFPAWELALSLAILVASILGAMWLAARMFRTFLLMYGKSPSPREVWRYIRQG
ncbi:MAG: ABC transporter permease [Chloroflexota bacterium]|nr:ABC transporter permease [Chloroflexota bacterium]